MDALQKTKVLVRQNLPLAVLIKNPHNPNRMTSREFDLLVDNMQRTGMTDAILVRPQGDGTYRIIGGHHRFDAAQFLGWDEVPCTIIDDSEFDDEAERFQMVRMNVIRGRMDPQKFFDLYQQVSGKYSDQVLQDAFGFADEAMFQKLIEQTTKSLPDPVMQQKFKEAAKEVKTIDGLAKVLNEIFTKYGDTLQYGFMVFDYGGQRSVWIEASEKTMKAFDLLAEICREKSRTMDALIGGLVHKAAKGELNAALDEIIAKAPVVALPAGMPVIPTKQNIEQYAAV